MPRHDQTPQLAHPRGKYNNQGYSALSRINTRNVKNLKLALTFSMGVNRGHEGTLLVINGVMYVHTAFPNNIYALDLNNNKSDIDICLLCWGKSSSKRMPLD
jgi:lanthanide-dependent methanol dehydrogenase